ncbi:MAG: DNA repair protein RecN [Nitrospirae bacterium]|nr:DNA repair protein RecN [Nitrospirota bacterium]
MLRQLRIKDFAIIDEVQLNLGEGFNVITGETGAGKSIIIGALDLLLGARAHADLIRAEREEAVLEAQFDTRGIAQAAPASSNGTALTIRRKITREGRGKVTFNEDGATLGQLEDLGRRLVGIYGQHEYMDLVLTAKQMAYLDEFGGLEEAAEKLEEERRTVARLYEELRDFDRLEKARRERIDLLSFQVHEIEGARIRPNEDHELESERNILAHAEKIAQALGEADRALYSTDGSVVEQVGRHAESIRTLGEIDPRLTPMAEGLASAKSLIQDAARDISSYLGSMEFDPKRLESVEERLYQLDRLKKKYGPDLDSVLRLAEEGAREIEELSRKETDRGALAKRFEADWEAFAVRAEKFLKERRRFADRLAREVEAGCEEVGLAKARFAVTLTPGWMDQDGKPAKVDDAGKWLVSATPTMTIGYDFSANPGEPLRDLSRIASGGERSRIMLVLKNILSKKKEGATLIFDEVDAGIGGAVAEAVGRKLRELSRRHQILCITHLPQIACFGDAHFLVRKRRAGSRTVTEIVELGREERLEELARMLGGEKISDKARAYAAELLRIAPR